MDHEIERLEKMITELRIVVDDVCKHTARMKRIRNLLKATEPSTGFGGRLRQKRLSAGYTMRELAALAGVSYQAVMAYERNHWAPRPAVLERLADALGVTPEELLADEVENAA